MAEDHTDAAVGGAALRSHKRTRGWKCPNRYSERRETWETETKVNRSSG